MTQKDIAMRTKPLMLLFLICSLLNQCTQHLSSCLAPDIYFLQTPVLVCSESYYSIFSGIKQTTCANNRLVALLNLLCSLEPLMCKHAPVFACLFVCLQEQSLVCANCIFTSSVCVWTRSTAFMVFLGSPKGTSEFYL